MTVLAPPCAADPELFFSEQPGDIERAKQTCAGCWRLQECEQEIAEDTPGYGVWAGVRFEPQPEIEVPATDVNEASKDCTACGENKPLTDFHRDRSARDGRQAHCAACRAIADAQRTRPARQPSPFAVARETHLDAQAVRAARLRESGLTYVQIAQQIGICRRNATRAVQRAYAKGLIETESAA